LTIPVGLAAEATGLAVGLETGRLGVGMRISFIQYFEVETTGNQIR